MASGLGGRLRPYRAVLASRARSQRAYRASFALDLGSSALTGLVELAEVWVLFSNVTALGGMRFNQILLVFGLADLAFFLAGLSFGHLDALPDFLRAGTLDAFYLRPQPILLQLITSDVSLRRLARAAVGAAALGAGLATAGVPPGCRGGRAPWCCWRSGWPAATPRSRRCSCGRPGCSSSSSTARR